jgi:hypothetical protein
MEIFVRYKVGGETGLFLPLTNAYNWIISDKKGVIMFLNLINGHLRTIRKLEQVRTNMASILPQSFKKTPLCSSSLLNSWWLAGFADAEGCFYIQMLTRHK